MCVVAVVAGDRKMSDAAAGDALRRAPVDMTTFAMIEETHALRGMLRVYTAKKVYLTIPV